MEALRVSHAPDPAHDGDEAGPAELTADELGGGPTSVQGTTRGRPARNRAGSGLSTSAGPNGRPLAAPSRHYAVGARTPLKVSSPPLAETWIAVPGVNSPASTRRASGSSR